MGYLLITLQFCYHNNNHCSFLLNHLYTTCYSDCNHGRLYKSNTYITNSITRTTEPLEPSYSRSVSFNITVLALFHIYRLQRRFPNYHDNSSVVQALHYEIANCISNFLFSLEHRYFSRGYTSNCHFSSFVCFNELIVLLP